MKELDRVIFRQYEHSDTENICKKQTSQRLTEA